MSEATRWAKLKDQMPLTADMIAAEESAQPHIKLIMSQLRCALTHMTKDDSLRLVKNIALEDSGLEAWRKLNRQYDPVGPLSNSKLLAIVQNPPQSTSMDTLLHALEKW